MKTLIFNGSPRRDGDTAALLTAFRAPLGGEITQIDAYRCGIAPCVDCRWCWTHAECALHDGMARVFAEMDAADNLVIASPVYFSELTGPLLSVFSRLQLLFAAAAIRRAPLLEKKPRRGVVLLARGGSGSGRRAEETAENLLRHMGAEPFGIVRSERTDTLPAREDRAALAAAAALGARCAERR